MKKTLATILALVMVLSVMSLTALAADEIKVDGDVSEWTGWVNVSAKDGKTENGRIQSDEGYTFKDFSYDYAVKVIGDTLYIAVKVNEAPIANEAPAQTNCTNVRFWVDNTKNNGKFSALFDFSYNGTTAVDTRAGNEYPYTAAVKAGEKSYTLEVSVKLADLGIENNNFGYAFTVSTPELEKKDDDGTLKYAALHSIPYENNDDAPWTTTKNFTVYSEKAEGDTSTAPETSTDASTAPETSTDASKAPSGGNPNTGDSMMVFALIALLTIGGTVVAIKRVR